MSEENKPKETFECQLFDWESWDQFDTMGFNFTGITLVKDIGPFKAGEKFACANMSYDKGILELGKDFDSEKVSTFSLTLTATFVS